MEASNLTIKNEKTDTNNSTSTNNHCCTQTVIPVVVNYVQPVGIISSKEGYPFRIRSKEFTLQKLVNVCDLSSEDNANVHHTIILRFLYSNDEDLDRSIRSIIYSSHGDSNNSMEDDKSYILELIQKGMQGRSVREGSIFPICLHVDYTKDEELSFFIVEQVKESVSSSTRDSELSPKQTYKDDDNSSVKTCYKINTCDNVDIVLSPHPHSSGERHGEYKDKTEPELSSTIHQTTICPGYESIVQDICNMAKISQYTGSPTSILLTGCPGVGKTKMITTVIEKMKQEYGPITSKIISAKDILLSASSTSSASKLVHMVLDGIPNQNDFTQKFLDQNKNPETKQRMRQIALVIDDIDAVFADDSTSEYNTHNFERVSSFNAIVNAVDQIMKWNLKDHGTSMKNMVQNGMLVVIGVFSMNASDCGSSLVKIGRFEKVVNMEPPTEWQRQKILEYLFSFMPIQYNQSNIPTQTIAKTWAISLASHTAGCVAADLKRLCIDAMTRAKSESQGFQTQSSISNKDRVLNNNNSSNTVVKVRWDHVKEATRSIVPSQLAQLDVSVTRVAFDNHEDKHNDPRAAFNTYWSNIGGYNEVKDKIYRSIVRPWKLHLKLLYNHEQNENRTEKNKESSLLTQIKPPTGIIFHGPTGTGKSLAAQSLAASLGLNVVNVRASDILDKWLGGSEAAIRSLFSRARAAAPCILLFDEIDSIVSNRDHQDDSTDVHSRVLSTFLNEMDGVSSGDGKQGVLIVATTNRLHSIDAALLRPGRLEEHIFLDNPNHKDILDILKLHLKKIPLHEDVNMDDIAELLFELSATGAKLYGICTEACLHAMRYFDANTDLNNISVKMSDFDFAIRQCFD